MRSLKYRWAVFAVLSAIYFFVYFHRMSSAVIAKELMDEFSVGAVAMGVMSSAYFYPYAILQIPVGFLSDTAGTRKTATAFTFIAFAGALMFGMAGSFSHAVIARVLMGAGVSGVYIPAIKAFSRWFRKQEFASITGIILAVGNFGALSASYPLAMMVIFFGWRFSFVLIAVITLILAILCWLIVRDSPESMGLESVVEYENSGGKSDLRKGFLRVISNRYFWLLAIWFFFEYGALAGFQGLWGGPYLVDVYHLSKSGVGEVLMMVGLGMMVGSPITGLFSDRILKTRKFILMMWTLMFLIAWAPLAFMTGRLSISTLYYISFLMGFSGSSLIIVFTSTKELFPLEITGIATSLVNIFPFVGAAVFQTIMGYILDLYGAIDGAYPPSAYSMAFKFCFIAVIVSLVSSIFVIETYPSSVSEETHVQA